jgi:prefoldin subunit 5
MTADCNHIRDLIDAGAFVDPSAEGYAEVAAHAAECESCSGRLSELREAEDIVRQGFAWFDPGAGFTARVMRGVSGRPRRRWIWPPLAAAAALMVAVIALQVLPQDPSQPMVVSVRARGEIVDESGSVAADRLPIGRPLRVGGEQAAFQTADGAGFALRAKTVFEVPASRSGRYLRVDLRAGGAAVSVKNDSKSQQVEIGVGRFALLTNDADFLVETSSKDAPAALYVDRGRVVVAFGEGVSVVEKGEHVELEPRQLVARLRAGKERITADLAKLEEQCSELKGQIARYEQMVQTYSERRAQRSQELILAEEQLAEGPDPERAAELEERVNSEAAAVENLDFVMSEHISKMTALRRQLPDRLDELRRRRELVRTQGRRLRRGLAALSGLR